MTALGIAWGSFLTYSLLGFIFSLVTWRYAPIISLVYVVGGFIKVFSMDHSTFGVTPEQWGSEYWKDVRMYMLVGHAILSGLLMMIEMSPIMSRRGNQAHQPGARKE